MNPIHWYIDNEDKRDNYITEVRNQVIGQYGFLAWIETGKRTLKQNSSIYLYFTLLADALNAAGLEIKMQYLGKSVDVPWTPLAVKERLWLPIMEAMTGKTSTAKLSRAEVSEIYEPLHRHLAETHAIYVPFPDNNEPR